MRGSGSIGLGLLGLMLAVGCAVGTELPAGDVGEGGAPEGGEMGTTSPPPGDTGSSQGIGMPPPGGTTGNTNTGGSSSGGSGYSSGGSSGGYEGGSSSYGDGGGSYYEGGSSSGSSSGSTFEGGSSSSGSSSEGGSSSVVCMGYAPPAVSAACTACTKAPCQANGCYGGYWCDMSTSKCHSTPPSGCP